MAELKWGAGTHPGRVRTENEDNLFVGDGLFVVADGMGGHEAGEVASRIAVSRIRSALSDDTSDLADASANAHRGESGPDEPVTSRAATDVVDAVRDANGDIFRAAIANPSQAGMGTTITAIAVIEDPLAGRGEPNIDDNDPFEKDPLGNPRVTPVVPRHQPEALVLANVGDSRTYLYRHGRLRRVTVDHNYVSELVASGHITDDEARYHPRRNIITRALGIEPDVTVDWWTLPLVKGDRYLLCSDGLVDEVTDAEITAVLSANADPQQAVDVLIQLANEAGGRDNITIVVVDVIDGDDPPEPTQELDIVPNWADDDTEPVPRDLLGETGEYVPADDGDLAVVPVASLSRKERRAIAKREKAARKAAKRADPSAGAAAAAAAVAATPPNAAASGPVEGQQTGEFGVVGNAAGSGTAEGQQTAEVGDGRAMGSEASESSAPGNSAGSGTVEGHEAAKLGGEGADGGAPEQAAGPVLGQATREAGDQGIGEAAERRRRRWPFVAGLVVVALVAAGVAGGAWARRGYYVDFDGSGDSAEVTVFQGRRGGVLWIEPTVAAPSGLERGQLTDGAVDEVREHPRFGSLDDAVTFVRELERIEETSDDADAPDERGAPDDTEP